MESNFQRRVRLIEARFQLPPENPDGRSIQLEASQFQFF